MTRSLLVALSLLLFATASPAQEKPLAPLPLGDVLLTLPTTHIPDAGTWEISFTHRFNQSIDEGEAVHSLFGLDSGANVTLGLSYTPLPRLQVALIRSNVLDTIEASGKYVLFQQARTLPFSAALRGGLDFRTERSLDDRVSLFAQALLSRQFGQRIEIFAMPTYVTDAGRVVVGERSAALFKRAFNVPIGAALQVRPAFSIVAELIPPNRDLPDDLSAELGWAVGIKKVVGGHLFEILLTNSSGTTTDQYATSSYNGAPLDTGDLRLGFNIERRWGKKR